MSNAAARTSKTSLWLIIALATAPVAASYVFYYFWYPESTTNYGELLAPLRLPDDRLWLTDGTPFRFSQLTGKWALVTVDSGRCNDYCERKLLYMRQLRLTQGKDRERVERAWLLADEIAPRPEAIAPYDGTWVVRGAGTDLLNAFPARVDVADHIYIVDPLGNVMMRFPRDPDPGRMVKDLSRLLKLSRIG